MPDTEKKIVMIRLKTTVKQNDDTETFEFNIGGELLIKQHAIFLRYTEIIADQSPTQVLFKFEKDAVRLHRVGDSTTKLTFALAQRLPAYYQTPAGQMQLMTDTKMMTVDVDLTQTQGTLALSYQLYEHDTIVGEYDIQLQFADKSSKLN
ncbi:DUF1934 domain-containing protein [Leuconostoc citreum]|uniref:DUF1934 domain-containing protein n=1 Tax=Leuconostoc citreum TaxID=33964 RepID=UPI0002465F03|nr:DUF1934 domain-containing protein [Leuconostoc citreum]MCS8583475.1 DUF1934 domain-containing protein [Leuconostoc citreum]MCS8601068.1 DUF1934 domain-containing protein [Leuconostoc citreum]TDM37772.1 DUF1934 domain-containing protein [Leuconostoc citreum]TPF04605.1 DUF1934 domain-containing protein [Leuconostoc citreum]CCF29222.1 Putative uncharacterized protein [Leuconostoc citreum LBAE E16]